MHPILATFLPKTSARLEDASMNGEARQRLNVRTIRVSLVAARRHALPDAEGRCIARARQLLEHARHEATVVSVISEIEALEAELRGADGAAQQRQG